MKKYYIRPIPLCKGPRDRSQWTYRINMGKKTDSCNYVWYIEGTLPNILVDAGATVEMYHMRGVHEETIQSLENGLDKHRLKPEDIDIIILTHLHWDHVALAYKFKKSKFVVQQAELDFAKNPHIMTSSGYDKKLFEGLDFDIIKGDREIVEGVQVILTPGHTPGGQSVVVNTPEGTAIITGFCCTRENFEPPEEARGLPVVAPGIHTNALQAYDSVLRVKQNADIIIPLHDIEFIGKSRIP
jgi:N-acyl homoserine lactone hydrolase